MIIGKVFQNDKVIAEGIKTSGKHYVEAYPEQNISVVTNTEIMEEEKSFSHDDEKNIYFKEYQDNGNGWEEVYDSRERIDRTVEYDLPSWFVHGGAIPRHEHTYKDGEIETTFKGYYR